MKKNFRLLVSSILSFFYVFHGPLLSQSKPSWQVNLDKAVNWYRLTSSGVFLIMTSEGLQGIAPEKKEIIWTMPTLKGLNGDQLKPLKGTPFYEITDLLDYKGETEAKEKKTLKSFGSSMFKSITKDITQPYNTITKGAEVERSIVLDPVNGKIIFDSKQVGISYINEKQFLSEINCFSFKGINDKKQVVGLVDVSNGKTLWIKENRIKNRLVSIFNEAPALVDPDGHLIYKYPDTTFRVNSRTGEIIWQAPTISAAEILFDNNDKKYLYNLATDRIDKVKLETGEIVQSYRPAATKQITGLSTPFEVIKHAINGSIDNHEIFVSGNNSFNYFDQISLTPKWEATSTFPSYSVKTANRQTDGNYLVSLKSFLTGELAISLTDGMGKAIWPNPYIIRGNNLKFLEYSPTGIGCITNEVADVISAATGTSRLVRPLELQQDEATLFAYGKDNNSIAILTQGILYQIDIANAALTKLVSKFGFEGDNLDKIPTRLEGRPGGYFLASEQNLIFINNNGSVKYKLYFKRPGMSEKARRMLSRWGGFTAGLVFSNQAQQATQTLYRSGLMNIDDYIITSYADYRYGGIGSAVVASDLAVEAFAKTAARTKLIQSSRNFHIVLSKLESGGTGFIKIDKDTGKEMQTLRLDDKEPNILIDDALVGMYYITPNEKQVMFYDLKN